MRYIQLFFKFLTLNLKGLKSYGNDFYIGVATMMLKNVASLVTLFFLYNLVPQIDGWSMYELLYMYSLSTMGFAMWRCLFMNTLNISYYVRKGILDSMLIRPLNPLFQIFMEGFDDDAWGDLIIGIIINIICIITLDLSWLNLACALLISLFASLIFASISILGSIISLRTVGVSDFSDLPYLLYELIKYPITLYGTWMTAILTFVVPIAWVSFIPSKILIAGNQWEIIKMLGQTSISALVFFGLSCVLWQHYLKRYTSTGT